MAWEHSRIAGAMMDKGGSTRKNLFAAVLPVGAHVPNVAGPPRIKGWTEGGEQASWVARYLDFYSINFLPVVTSLNPFALTLDHGETSNGVDALKVFAPRQGVTIVHKDHYHIESAPFDTIFPAQAWIRSGSISPIRPSIYTDPRKNYGRHCREVGIGVHMNHIDVASPTPVASPVRGDIEGLNASTSFWLDPRHNPTTGTMAVRYYDEAASLQTVNMTNFPTGAYPFAFGVGQIAGGEFRAYASHSAAKELQVGATPCAQFDEIAEALVMSAWSHPQWTKGFIAFAQQDVGYEVLNGAFFTRKALNLNEWGYFMWADAVADNSGIAVPGQYLGAVMLETEAFSRVQLEALLYDIDNGYNPQEDLGNIANRYAAFAAFPADAGLVSGYRLHEPEDATRVDSVGSLDLDEAGVGDVGSTGSSAKWTNNTAWLASGANGPVQPGSDPFSVAFRVKFGPSPATCVPVGQASADANINFRFMCNPGGSVTISTNAGGGAMNITGLEDIFTDGEWHLIAASFDPGGKYELWVDDEYNSVAGVDLAGTITELTVGAQGDGSRVMQVDDELKDVYVWNRAITSEDINRLKRGWAL